MLNDFQIVMITIGAVSTAIALVALYLKFYVADFKLAKLNHKTSKISKLSKKVSKTNALISELDSDIKKVM